MAPPEVAVVPFAAVPVLEAAFDAALEAALEAALAAALEAALEDELDDLSSAWAPTSATVPPDTGSVSLSSD